MNTRKIYSIIIALVLFSCESLDEDPSSFVTPEGFYQNVSQVETVFASSMNNLWNIWSNYAYRATGVLKNDDLIYGGDLVISSDWGSSLWSAHFSSIYNLNKVVAALKDGIDGMSDDDADLLMGQARFLRAYNYFMLVRMFGDLPLITEEIEDPINAEISRSPVSDVYALITSDFLYATKTLPDTWSSDSQGRPSKDAALGLLAKAYLTMACYPLHETDYYDSAAYYAKQVMDAGTHYLEEDINDVFTVETKYGPEMMWSFNSNYEDKASNIKQWSYYYGWTVNAVEPTFAERYPDQPRKEIYIELEHDGSTYEELGVPPGVGKFLYDSDEDKDDGVSIVNMPIIRYADVLLIYAEAANMANGGPTQEAVNAINEVIDRANGSTGTEERATTSMSQDEFDEKVIEERALELCFEFDRWFVLIRKHILYEFTLEKYQQNFTEDDYLFPIPTQDMRLNPLLVQNPGYY